LTGAGGLRDIKDLFTDGENGLDRFNRIAVDTAVALIIRVGLRGSWRALTS